MQVTTETEEFLHIIAIKVQFIDFLINARERNQCCSKRWRCRCRDFCAINVISDDTDVLILLMYCWSPLMCDLYFSTEILVHKNKIQKYSIGSRLSVSS